MVTSTTYFISRGNRGPLYGFFVADPTAVDDDGRLLPNSGLLVTIQPEGSKDTMTRAVVSDLQVLTAGTRYDQEKARDGQPIPTSVVTLLVTPADAEKIALASAEGSIMLTLRNPLDRAPTETQGARTSALLGQAPAPPPVIKQVQSRRVAAPAPAPAPPPPPKVYTVEAIRGAKRSEEVVR